VGEGLEIRVPDIGDFEDVEVVEILVAKGDRVDFDDPLVSIESDKATMEIPSPTAGVVLELRVSEGDRVSEGSVLVVLDDEGQGSFAEPELPAADAGTSASEHSPEATWPATDSRIDEVSTPVQEPVVPADRGASLAIADPLPVPDREGVPHASPLVRRFARELGVALDEAEGSGAHGRVLVDDVKRHVRDHFDEKGEAAATGPRGPSVPELPLIDYSAFGPVREEPLTRIQKVSGPALHRSWLNVPHVTQHDEADVTELERFRRDRRDAAAERGVKLSPLLFVMKAVVVALRTHPTFRASLAPEGDRLIVKDYYHLGIAVDTDQGLVVPVIRDVDRKGILELAEELAATAERARQRKLGPDDLRGACFTISSLGGIGGTAFSPIVNAPEVAILGLSQTRVAPRWEGTSPLEPGAAEAGRFEPRMMLPLSLSYDHRVIDGAEAVRFTSHLARLLTDPGFLLL